MADRPINSVYPNETAYLSTGVGITTNAQGITQVVNNPRQLSFPFDPNNLNFSYNLNKASFDTYGGRVTQILSVKINTMQIQGDAGSRANLVAFFSGVKALQELQIQTNTPLQLMLPNSGLGFYVYLEGIDIGWDPTSTTYPYNLTLQVQDRSYLDAQGSAINYNQLSSVIMTTEIKNLFNGATSNGIGYNKSVDGKVSLSSAYYAGMIPVSQANYSNNSGNPDPTYTISQLQNTNTGLGSNDPSVSSIQGY